jgi:hypothetical protein
MDGLVSKGVLSRRPDVFWSYSNISGYNKLSVLLHDSFSFLLTYKSKLNTALELEIEQAVKDSIYRCYYLHEIPKPRVPTG